MKTPIPSNYVQVAPDHWVHPSMSKTVRDQPNQLTQSAEVYRVLSRVVDAPKPPKRVRQDSKPLMNKLETEFLESVLKYRFRLVYSQSMRFMLGNGVWYKPDFIAFPVGLESQDSRVRAFEVKGPYAFRGGFENLKVAAHKYRTICWTLAWKEGVSWEEQTILP